METQKPKIKVGDLKKVKYKHILSKSSNSKTSMKSKNSLSSKSDSNYNFRIIKVWSKGWCKEKDKLKKKNE